MPKSCHIVDRGPAIHSFCSCRIGETRDDDYAGRTQDPDLTDPCLWRWMKHEPRFKYYPSK
eukprot:592336-Lingulodinium_polyedra.AAC.1